jgi:hypothetical protein
MLAGCGYVGPPLPPALNIPRQVTDLRAEVIGDKLIVHFTPPARTTEDLPITELRGITLYVGPGEAEFSRDRWSAAAARYQVDVTKTNVELLAAPFAGQQLVLGLRTTGRTGRESDWSNLEPFIVTTPLRQPAGLVFANLPDALQLKWTGNAPRYRISRVVDGKLETLEETDGAEYVDHAVVMGTRYEYVIVGMAGDKQQSVPSERFPFTPMDIFEPSVPSGLTAVASGRSVDLSWAGSADADLAGYNLFRAVGDGPFEALAQKVSLPAFTDVRVESGKRYRYVVSAVDAVGNESGRSNEAGVQVE